MESDRKDPPVVSGQQDGIVSDENRREVKGWNLFSLGIEFVLIFGGMLWIGSYLDSSLNSTPICTIAGAILGFIFSIMHIIRRARV